MADLKLRLAERQKDKDELQKAYESLMDLSHDEKTVIKIRFENLLPYCDHPYQLDPSAVLDLCEDIKENGLICPIIVRRKDGLFEILSGHCRTAAMQLAGYDGIDAYVIKATDEEAANIVIQSNLKQRKTILPSEYAKSLKLRNQYLISNKEKPLYSADKKVCSPMGNGGRVCLQLEKEFNISKSDIFRYIKLNNLINELLKLVDDRKLALRSAVALSGLAEIDQKIVYQYFYVEHSGKMDMRTAEKIKELVKRLILRGGSYIIKTKVVIKCATRRY